MPQLPTLLLQSIIRRAQESDAAWAIVSMIVAAALAVASAFGATWLARDAKRRGHNAALWLAIWLAGPAVGLISFVSALAADEPTTAAVGFSGWIVLGAAAAGLLWFAMRRSYPVYSADGEPVHPTAVLRKNPPFSPGQPPPSRREWRPVAQQAGWLLAGESGQPTYAPHVPPAPVPSGPRRAQVRCPACRTVFEYAPNPAGPTRVACPTCRLAGTI